MNTQIINFSLIIVSLAPLSIQSGINEGISANYSFALIIPLLAGLKFKRNTHSSILIFIFSCSFIASIPINYIYQQIDVGNFLRQCASLLIFFSPFILLHIDLENLEDIFIKSVVTISVAYSIAALLYFSSHIRDYGINPFVIKDALSEKIPDWPQRYVLVLFAGFFYSYEKNIRPALIYVIRAVLLATIFITFLRAAFLAITVGFIVHQLVDKKSISASTTKLKRFLLLIPIIILAFFITESFHGDLIESSLTILNYFTESAESLISGNGADNVSDQNRVDLLSAGLTKINPITGLGGAGIYFITPDVGSAHNQFLDYYVRFGAPGLIAFLYFNYRIARHFIKSKPWIIGLLATYLTFGIAHETTKYSYGSLIFFFLLSLTYRSSARAKITAPSISSRITQSRQESKELHHSFNSKFATQK